jgi:hypothetical protein
VTDGRRRHRWLRIPAPLTKIGRSVRTAGAPTIRGAAVGIGLWTSIFVLGQHVSFDDSSDRDYFPRHIHEGDKPVVLAFCVATILWCASLLPGISDRTTMRLAWASLNTVIACALLWGVWVCLLRARIV